MLIQLLIADITGIKSKHIPGAGVPSDHGNFLFRSTRAVANTNESIAVFIVAVLFCIHSNADPAYTAYASWAFVTLRVVYAFCYYANLQILRSVTFGLSFLCLFVLLFIGAAAFL
jgi:uncharacterized MAPEG superfamily protein